MTPFFIDDYAINTRVKGHHLVSFSRSSLLCTCTTSLLLPPLFPFFGCPAALARTTSLLLLPFFLVGVKVLEPVLLLPFFLVGVKGLKPFCQGYGSSDPDISATNKS